MQKKYRLGSDFNYNSGIIIAPLVQKLGGSGHTVKLRGLSDLDTFHLGKDVEIEIDGVKRMLPNRVKAAVRSAFRLRGNLSSGSVESVLIGRIPPCKGGGFSIVNGSESSKHSIVFNIGGKEYTKECNGSSSSNTGNAIASALKTALESLDTIKDLFTFSVSNGNSTVIVITNKNGSQKDGLLDWYIDFEKSCGIEPSNNESVVEEDCLIKKLDAFTDRFDDFHLFTFLHHYSPSKEEKLVDRKKIDEKVIEWTQGIPVTKAPKLYFCNIPSALLLETGWEENFKKTFITAKNYNKIHLIADDNYLYDHIASQAMTLITSSNSTPGTMSIVNKAGVYDPRYTDRKPVLTLNLIDKLEDMNISYYGAIGKKSFMSLQIGKTLTGREIKHEIAIPYIQSAVTDDLINLLHNSELTFTESHIQTVKTTIRSVLSSLRDLGVISVTEDLSDGYEVSVPKPSEVPREDRDKNLLSFVKFSVGLPSTIARIRVTWEFVT